jgi:dolichol-phosphate mannosyltransferase
MKSVFFVNAYNEIQHMPAVIDELRNTDLPCDAMLLVNNGSNDGTEELVRNAGFPYIDTPLNQGANAGYMNAIQWALDNEYDVIGGMSGNGKMLASEIGIVLQPLLEDKADWVNGSRFLPGSKMENVPLFRRLSIPFINRFVNTLYGANLTDSTGGFRAFRTDLIRQTTFDWKAPWLRTYGLEYYLYGKVLMTPSVRCLEVPITSRYPKRGTPYSKISPGRDWYEMLKPWVVARFDNECFERPRV